MKVPIYMMALTGKIMFPIEWLGPPIIPIITPNRIGAKVKSPVARKCDPISSVLPANK